MSIDNTEDLGIIMPIYNLLEYSHNYYMTLGSLWNYYRYEINTSVIEITNDSNMINNDKTITNKSFEYKKKIIGNTPDDNNTLNAKVVVLLKNLSNFWRFLDLRFTNCKIELDPPWSKECIVSEISITSEVRVDNPVDVRQRAGATSQINNAKLYVPVVTLSTNDNIKFLENIKQGFIKTISWNKYRSEITTNKKQ